MPDISLTRPQDELGVKERIVSAAENLFVSHGYMGATVEKIVTAARTSKREFYKYFANRDAVLREVLVHVLASMGEQASLAPSLVQGPVEEAIRHTVHFMYTRHNVPRGLGLLRASLAASRWAPDLAIAAYLNRSNTPGLNAYFAAKKEAGQLSFDLPQLAAIRVGFLSTDGLRFMAGEPPLGEAEMQAHIREVADVALHGHATAEFRSNPKLKAPGLRLTRIAEEVDEDISSRTRLLPSDWDRLRDVAWLEFKEKGYTAASIPAISSKAAFPRNTIYRHYNSKEKLFFEISKNIIFNSFSQINATKGVYEEVIPFLQAAGDAILVSFLNKDNLELHKLMMSEAGKSPEIGRFIHGEISRRVDCILEPAFSRLVEMNIIRRDLYPKAKWRFFVLVTLGSRFLFVSEPSEKERKNLISEAVRMFLFGFRLNGA